MWPFTRRERKTEPPTPSVESLIRVRQEYEKATRRCLMTTTLCDATAFLNTKYKTRVIQHHEFWPVPDPQQKVHVYVTSDEIQIESAAGYSLVTCYLNLKTKPPSQPVALSASEAAMYDATEDNDIDVLIATEIL